MIGTIIRMIITVTITYIVGIFFHELGHAVIYAEVTGKTPKFKLNKTGKFGYEILLYDPEDLELKKLNNKEYFKVLFGGVLAGTIAITFIILFFFDSFLLSIPILLIYFTGCRNDIISMIKANKGE